MIGRAQQSAAARQTRIAVQQLGQPAVGQIRLALRIQEDIAGFEIAMQNPALAGVMNGAGEGRHELRNGRWPMANGRECSTDFLARGCSYPECACPRDPLYVVAI